jgi:peptide/nickel transport system substrate-binding protein
VTEPDKFDYPGLGYGPFKIVDKKDGEYYYCERVPDWPLANDGYGALLDSITFRVYEDANSMTLALLNGEIDACGNSSTYPVRDQIAADNGSRCSRAPPWVRLYGHELQE